MNFGSKISFADRWFLYFLLSDSISDRTLLLLFLDAVEFFAALNNTCISARTIALLLLYNSYIHCADGYVAAKLMCRLISIARRATLL